MRPASGAARAPAAPASPKAPAAAAPSWNWLCSITASVDQKALKPTASRPWASAARRKAACWRHSPHMERISASQPSWVVGAKCGRPRHTATASRAMAAAASRYMLRQPQSWATRPLTTRDSKMPSSSPVITVPTMRPRWAAGASVAAAGTTSCAMVAARPTPKLAASRLAMPGARPLTSSASTKAAALAKMMRRRSYRSPSGASSKMPNA